jgi:hypothetical protein
MYAVFWKWGEEKIEKEIMPKFLIKFCAIRIVIFI